MRGLTVPRYRWLFLRLKSRINCRRNFRELYGPDGLGPPSDSIQLGRPTYTMVPVSSSLHRLPRLGPTGSTTRGRSTVYELLKANCSRSRGGDYDSATSDTCTGYRPQLDDDRNGSLGGKWGRYILLRGKYYANSRRQRRIGI